MNDNPSNFRPQNSNSGSQQYLDASVRMASPAKLRLMVLERAVEVSGLLASQWRNGEKLGSNEHSLMLMELISELLSGVAGGSNETENQLCLKVADLYVFLLKHLIIAEENSDAGSVEEIQLVLQAETETWRVAVASEARVHAASQGGSVPSPISASTGTESTSSSGLNFSA